MSERTPILLHACCGPCSLEPVLRFRDEGWEPTICWTNPNIQPVAEHDKRLATLRAWCGNPLVDIRVVEASCDRDAWERACARHRFDREARCRACYAIRIAEACRVAKELGIEHVSTTLAVSPYQLFDVCMEELVSIAKAHGLTPVVRDFRDYYDDATKLSRELGMYRQNYCGCRFSAAEAALERQERRDAARAKREAEREGVFPG